MITDDVERAGHEDAVRIARGMLRVGLFGLLAQCGGALEAREGEEPEHRAVATVSSDVPAGSLKMSAVKPWSCGALPPSNLTR
jgi:hypothetical protein